MFALTPLVNQKNFRYATFDVETTMGEEGVYNVFSMVGFFDGEKYYCFREMKDFLNFIFSVHKYRGYRIFAHNGGDFDFKYLMQVVRDSFPDLSSKILSSGGISMIVIYSPSQDVRWYFCDSIKLFPMSLRALTHTFNVEHKKLEMKLENIGWNEETKHYNEYDCRGLYEALTEFYKWQGERHVGIKATIASQSMAYFRSTMKGIIPNLTSEQEEFVRIGYYGGRTEIFKMLSEKKLFCYDVNSMYPYVMKKYAMPVGVPRKTASFVDGAAGFYAATVYVPEENYIPVLPVRMSSGKIVFPVGMINGVYSSVELLRAEEIGCEVEIHGGYYFGSKYIFDEFVDTLYKIKKEGNDGEKMISKLMLVGCYGKFGQTREKISLLLEHELSKCTGTRPYSWDDGIFEQTSVSRARFIIPSISAWITACARVELFNFMEKAGLHTVFYCDTDSVMTTTPMPSGKDLGQMKLEREVNRAVFMRPKNYILETTEGTIVKAKGYEKEFRSKLSFDDYLKGLADDYSAFNQSVKRAAGLKESLRRNHCFLSVIDRKKSIQTDYNKRRILPDYDTAPLCFQ